VLNYNYLYALNGWLLINPTWLCFDWSMGCIPVITTITDRRLMAIIVFWMILGFIIWRALFHLKPTDQRLVLFFSTKWLSRTFRPIALFTNKGWGRNKTK
jgi:protein O-mannosyl-transferase